MTEEFNLLKRNLDSAFFRYAHITGAIELYMSVLENPELQRAMSKFISGSETDWKQIHRFMVIDGQTVTWYPELPVQAILAEKNALLGFLYGITLSRMIGDLDFYLSSVLKNHFGHLETSGSSWDPFIQKTKIELLSRTHGKFVYTLLQERHKIEHNQAQIDRVFLERMAKRNIQHAYKEGDGIQKSHIDVLLAHQAIREFAEDVDLEVSRLLGALGDG
jgi:hypothetical protein